MKVHLIRHAQSIGNSKKIYQGQMDYELTDLGRKQANDLADQLSEQEFDAIYYSPLLRVSDTVGIFLSNYSISPTLYPRDGLMERDLGKIEGVRKPDMTEAQQEIRHMMKKEDKFNGHNGETLQDFKKRVISTFNEIIEHAKTNDYSTIAIFTHHGVLRTIASEVIKISKDQFQNAEVTVIEKIGKNWSIVDETPAVIESSKPVY